MFHRETANPPSPKISFHNINSDFNDNINSFEDNATKRRVLELQQSAREESKKLNELSNELQNRLAEYFRDQKVYSKCMHACMAYKQQKHKYL
jgi:hypothetical protein